MDATERRIDYPTLVAALLGFVGADVQVTLRREDDPLPLAAFHGRFLLASDDLVPSAAAADVDRLVVVVEGREDLPKSFFTSARHALTEALVDTNGDVCFSDDSVRIFVSACA